MSKSGKAEPSGDKRWAPSLVRCVGPNDVESNSPLSRPNQNQPDLTPNSTLTSQHLSPHRRCEEEPKRSSNVALTRYNASREQTVIRPMPMEESPAPAPSSGSGSSHNQPPADNSILRLPLVVAVPADESLIALPPPEKTKESAVENFVMDSSTASNTTNSFGSATTSPESPISVRRDSVVKENRSGPPPAPQDLDESGTLSPSGSGTRSSTGSQRGSWISSMFPRRRSSKRSSTNPPPPPRLQA